MTNLPSETVAWSIETVLEIPFSSTLRVRSVSCTIRKELYVLKSNLLYFQHRYIWVNLLVADLPRIPYF